jgi:hypothetical protein
VRVDQRIGIFPSISAEPFFLKSKTGEFVWALVVKIDTSLVFEVPVSELTTLPMDCQMYIRAVKGQLFDTFGSRVLGQIADVAIPQGIRSENTGLWHSIPSATH